MTESLAELQRTFTAWLRHPGQAPAPAGIEARRLAIYRDLLFNNVMTFVDSAFPVALALLPAALTARLKQEFFANHACQSPYFTDISLHFREYVESLDWPELARAPWLTELLHYEWVELAADISPAPPSDTTGQRMLAADDLDEGRQPDLRLAAPTWALAYHWPVQRWRRDTDPASLAPEDSCLVLWRDADEQVQVLTVEPLAAWLVEQLTSARAGTDPCPAALAGQLCALTPGLDMATAETACRRLLQGLLRSGLPLRTGT